MDSIKNTYFIGIGGIGMSALARYFNRTGKRVLGYDKTKTVLTETLESEGIEIYYEESPERLSGLNIEETLFIYTPAIPPSHRELQYLHEHNIKVYKRSEVLGLITSGGTCLAVAGTHGKTTTSSILAHLLTQSGKKCNAFVGGIMTNYDSNIIINPESDIYVVEADEFDRSFLALHPDISIITSMDADHLDIYGKADELRKSFNLFAGQSKEVIIEKNLADKIHAKTIKNTYSINKNSDFMGENLQIKNGKYHFDFIYQGKKIEGIQLGLPGKHNVENAIAAIAVAIKLNVSPQAIKQALREYRGVKRRFEQIISTEKQIFIDDYAHHPTEIAACIKSVRALHPGKKILGIFQPHLYSRTRDFADEFAQSLDLLDDVILLPVYPAREKPIQGIDSQIIFDKITKTPKKIVQKSELLYEIKEHDFDILITLGAGDIDALVLPIKQTVFK